MPPRAYQARNDFGLEELVEKAYATQSEYVIGTVFSSVETFLFFS